MDGIFGLYMIYVVRIDVDYCFMVCNFCLEYCVLRFDDDSLERRK